MNEAGTNLYHRKELRQKLRNNATPAERILWWYLQKRKFHDLKWRRQVSIGNYIVDFYCFKKRAAIEIDGDTHFTDEAIEYDKKRTTFLEKNGIRVIRFTNPEIKKHTDECLERLEEFLFHTPSNSPYKGEDISHSS